MNSFRIFAAYLTNVLAWTIDGVSVPILIRPAFVLIILFVSG